MKLLRLFVFPVSALLLFVVVTPSALAGFHAVASRDGVDVWAVGDAGSAWRSFDSGNTWTSRTLGTQTLRGIAARNFVVIAVADSGRIYRSADSGGTWTVTTVAGSPDLRAIEMPTTSVACIAGAAGTLLKSTDAGLSWTPQASGTVERLNGLRFTDDLTGWAVGNNGTVLATTDGGATWNPVSTGATGQLNAVDAYGARVWIVGNEATALKSGNGGASWTPVNLKIDSRADVAGVALDATTVTLTGGGGFVRRSIDDGLTWSYPLNPIQGEATDIFFVGLKGWVVNGSNNTAIRTINGGLSWVLPAATSVTRTWNQKLVFSGIVRGSTLAMHPTHKNTYYCCLGPTIYKSENRGENWVTIATIPGVSKTNAFYVSPHDSLLMVAAVGGTDHIVRSTDGGATWTTTLTVNFTEYGVPMEMDVNDPDHLLFAPEDGKLYTSNDFGATWTVLSTPGFRSPCDIQIVADSSQVIWVGDGVTGSGQGQIFRSVNGGLTFTLRHTTTGSEIPMIAGSHLQNEIGFSTAWSSGGVRFTKDMGDNWLAAASTASAWGTDISRDDPNVVMYGVYSGGLSYLSLDQGQSFSTASLPGSNYSIWIPERNTLLAEQSGGIYKLSSAFTTTPTTSQTMLVLDPNGGQVWKAGSHQYVSWYATNVAMARIEYRKAPGEPWQFVADTTGTLNSYPWTVPDDATTQAKVRVLDAWDGTPVDSSNATFTILSPRISLTPDSLAFGPRFIGSATLDSITILASGTDTLVVSSISVAGSAFTPGRTALTLPPGAQDTVGVTFLPSAALSYDDTLVIVSNDPGSPHRIPLSGSGIPVPTLVLVAPNGGEAWAVGESHRIEWASMAVDSLALDYRVAPDSAWVTVADSLPATPAGYAWTVPLTPTSQARVRIRELGGGLADSSDADFSLTVPLLTIVPDTLDVGQVAVGLSGGGVLRLYNGGTAPLHVTSLTSDNPTFTLSRTSLVIAPADSDTVTVFFAPQVPGADTALVVVGSDDPFQPDSVVAMGNGQSLAAAGDDLARPRAFALRANQPNPFTRTTRIHYALPSRVPVSLDVFDLSGRRVASLVHAEQGPGEFVVDFGPGAVTPVGERIGALRSGIYFYRLQAGGYSRTLRMMLVH